eukprot:COSAG06_NODE_2099_length_7600_cov_12.023730_2_plen_291_part_00
MASAPINLHDLVNHVPQIVPLIGAARMGRQGSLKSIDEVSHTCLFGNTKVVFQHGDMAGDESTPGVAFKNTGSNTLKIILPEAMKDDFNLGAKAVAEEVRKLLVETPPENNILAKVIADAHDSEDIEEDVKEKLRTLLEFNEAEECTGVKDLSIGECTLHDDHFNAETLPITFFNGARVIEIKEDKGVRTSGPFKLFPSSSATIATELNVAFLRGELGFKITFDEAGKGVVSMTAQSKLIVLTKTDQAANAELDEINAAIKAKGHKTKLSGDTGGAAPAKKAKFTFGKKA